MGLCNSINYLLLWVLNIFIRWLSIWEYQMADTVKKNGRNRRPPSHLIDGYNEDNFEPRNNLNLGNRVT